MRARPVGQRRAGDHDRADQIRPDGAHHHDLPAGLAVADQARLALRFRVQLGNLGDEARLGAANVLDGLTWNRVLQEADEVTGMPGLQHLADLALMLHPANARPLPGTRIENDERTLARIHRNAGRRPDANEDVIHRAIKRPSVQHHLETEVQDRGRYPFLLFLIAVAALAQDVQCQNPTLPSI